MRKLEKEHNRDSLLSIPICLSLDYIAFLNKAWAVPTIFPFRILKLVPMEDFVYLFLTVYIIVIIYENLFEQIHKINYGRLNNFWLAILTLTTIFFALFLWFPDYLIINYYYSWLLLIVFAVPTIIGLILFPKIRKPIFLLAPFFFIYTLSFELIALHLGLW